MTGEVKLEQVQKAPKKRKVASLDKRKARVGWIFVLPFIIGFVLIYLPMVISSLQLAFSDMTIIQGGGITFKFTGFENFQYALFTDAGFVQALVTGIGELGGGTDLIGILFGLGAAVFYAVVILLNKFIKNVEGIHRTFLQFLSAIVILLPYVLMTSGVTLGSLDGLGWGNLLIVGLVHTGVTYCMYFSSLKELPGQKAAILSYMDPLVAVVISVTLLGETMTLWQAAGGLLILGFTLWNEISPKAGAQGKNGPG